MNSIRDILSETIGSPLSDIVMFGFADIDEEPLDVILVRSRIFIHCDEKILKVTQVTEERLGLNAEYTTEEFLDPEYEEDHTGFVTFRASVDFLILGGSERQREITEWDIFRDNNGECVGLKVKVASGRICLFSPFSFDGIECGGDDYLKLYLESNVYESVEKVSRQTR